MPNAPEPPPSLKTLVDAIAALETQCSADSVTGVDRVRQKATLKFLASLKELVQAFCMQGSGDDEGELGYLITPPFTLRGK